MMSFYDDLQRRTAAEREAFLAIPLIGHAVKAGVTRPLYVDFLGQAYHHVKHTCPLLALAAVRCGPEDGAYRNALFDYIDEEKGHDEWILEDIAAMGGDALAVRHAAPRLPCKAMVAYAYYAIDHVSPYALLGMVHVLEGMSVALATQAAGAIAASLGGDGKTGFSYLSSHGELDKSHVSFFQRLVDGIHAPKAREAVVEAAQDIYVLYGDIFRDIGRGLGADNHAA